MSSLNSYEKGEYHEGKRISLDIEAGNAAMALLTKEIHKPRGYTPRLVLLRGNHEDRLDRLIRQEPKLRGVLSDTKFESPGWQVVPFLEPITIDGVMLAHYFYAPLSGRAYGGTVQYKLGKIHHSFTQGHVQGLDVGRVELPGGRRLRGLVAGCLTPDHKVLTADLRYIPLGEITVGQKLTSFDESSSDSTGRSRRYKTGTVLNVRSDFAEVFLVVLASGKSFKVTADHVWLTKNSNSDYKWQRTDQLRRGMGMPRLLPEWETLTSYQAGWLAGMIDGEGHLYARLTTGGSVMQLGVSQKRGPTLDRLHATLLAECGEFGLTNHVQNDVMSMQVRGGVCNVAKVLGSVRPERLLAKFRPEFLGMVHTKKGPQDKVVDLQSLGRREIVRSLVDCGTLIVEGYPHHNSFYQKDEEYKGPQANCHWRGILVKNEVNDGDYDLLEVSLDYLLRKWT